MERRTFLGLVGVSIVGNVAFANEAPLNDIWVREEQKALLAPVIAKLDAVERVVGYAKFNLISFDSMLLVAKNHPKIIAFTPAEIAYIEEIFYIDPRQYGFYGKRTIERITETIAEKDVVKIHNTGHYLYKGTSHDALGRIVKDVGSSVMLTSGVRSVVKQLSLHLHKIQSENGNITLASRSLVPPGYSYHSLGDFDVGKRGWGHENFTANFARTKEFWSLQKLPYISMRYSVGNSDGVRFEPWHVQIV
jgi:hypothetical protein